MKYRRAIIADAGNIKGAEARRYRIALSGLNCCPLCNAKGDDVKSRGFCTCIMEKKSTKQSPDGGIIEVEQTLTKKISNRLKLRYWNAIKSHAKRTNTPLVDRISRKEKVAFFSSRDWLKIRFKVLTTYPRKCMCCGSTENLHVDHIKPVSRYPELKLDFNNLQILCKSCNLGKSNIGTKDFRNNENQIKYTKAKEKQIAGRKKQKPRGKIFNRSTSPSVILRKKAAGGDNETTLN